MNYKQDIPSSERKWTSKFWTKSAYTDIFVRATTTYTSKQDIPPLQSSERKWTSVEQNIPPLHWSLYFQVRYTPFTMVESQIYLYAMEDNDIEYTSNIYYLCMQWKIYTHAIRKTRYMYPLYRKQNVIKNVQTKFATFTSY